MMQREIGVVVSASVAFLFAQLFSQPLRQISPRPAVAEHGRSCAVARWDAPRLIDSNYPRMVARFPSLTGGESRAYVMGNNVPYFDSTPVAIRPLSIWQLGVEAEKIPPPPGAFNFSFPKTAAEPNGKIHLLWGEKNLTGPVEAFRWVLSPVTSIWEATYSPNSGWTKPQELPVKGRIPWRRETSSELLIRKNGDLAFALASPTLRQGITLVQRSRGTWTSVVLPFTGAYTALAGVGDRIFLSYVDALKGTRNDINSVFITYSDDNGANWNQPRLVSRSGDQGAFELRLLSLQDGLHLLWTEATSQGSSVIRHVVSADRGSHWSGLQDLVIHAAPGMSGLVVTDDACGGIHALFENWTNGPEDKRLDYAYWNSVWQPTRSLFPHYRAGDGALVRLGARILLIFTAQKTGVPISSAVSTFYSYGNTDNKGIAHVRP